MMHNFLAFERPWQLSMCRARATRDNHELSRALRAEEAAETEPASPLAPAGPPGPIGNSYWVLPGKLLAGPYPDSVEDAAKLAVAGITVTVDLTRSDEGWIDYWSESGLEHHRIPFWDLAAPSREAMDDALATVDTLLSRGASVYVHCKGGRGRTGCVIACYLIDQGATAAGALTQLREWCGHPHSPETDEQREMVRAWSRGR